MINLRKGIFHDPAMAAKLPSLILHEDPISAHCYKIRLTASLLGVPIQRRAYSILKKETRTPEFLEKVNAWGKIPVLQIGDDPKTAVFLPESHAACWWLAESTASPLIPSSPLDRAEMLRWMFWEQMHVDVSIATARYWMKFLGTENLDERRKAQLPGMIEDGTRVLERLEAHLKEGEGRKWFVGENVSLADVALFAYVHLITESGWVEPTGWKMSNYPNISDWCTRVEGVEGFVKF